MRKEMLDLVMWAVAVALLANPMPKQSVQVWTLEEASFRSENVNAMETRSGYGRAVSGGEMASEIADDSSITAGRIRPCCLFR